jgi:hypothetical protein
MSELENKHLTKSLGPFCLEKWSKTTKKSFFMLLLAICAPPDGHKKVHKHPQAGGIYGPMSKIKNKP